MSKWKYYKYLINISLQQTVQIVQNIFNKKNILNSLTKRTRNVKFFNRVAFIYILK